MQNDLAIIILNYNTEAKTLSLAISLIHQGILPQQIIVVDNHSSNQVDWKKHSEQHRFHFMANPKNGGYAYGNNQGVKKAMQLGYHTFLILNPDIQISYTVVSNLYQTLHTHPKQGIIGPRICDKFNPDIIYSDGGLISDWQTMKTHHFHYKEKITHVKVPTLNTHIQYVNGSAIMFKQMVLDRIGWMNEKFFMYGEETEWCIRAKNAEIDLGILTDQIAYHEASYKSNRYYYYMLRNRLWLVKEFNGKGFWKNVQHEGMQLLKLLFRRIRYGQQLPTFYKGQWKALLDAVMKS